MNEAQMYQNDMEASEMDPEFTIHTRKGRLVQGKLIETYPLGKLWFAQDRIVITNPQNFELEHIDVIELVCKVRPIEYFPLKEEDINYTIDDTDEPTSEEELDRLSAESDKKFAGDPFEEFNPNMSDEDFRCLNDPHDDDMPEYQQ